MKPWIDIEHLVNSIVKGITAHQHKVGAEEIEETLKEINFQLERIAVTLESRES